MEDAMSPTIRIDDEVYAWLQKNAKPFEDTPNSVLRRMAGFDQPTANISNRQVKKESKMYVRKRELNGRMLNEKWGVMARHALYHKDGHWYNNLDKFPGAYFDPHGYILFRTEEDYRNCPYIKIGDETNVPKGISSIPGYINVE
jgi:hypothetical protein